ncbi:winged helix-turn-helix domain-containing protein [Glaciihabitans sp. INWT7]|uniref:winged helix-turn-helix domain-containing protein n=1 Tax=Glaciihabitans sp. INWT7 TaxID=2596912 RepID=UPI001628C24A|nr:crosslink repair DNA glycosylase YcaQ family protein [Glaciihabitans sp. INWT7]QNE47598.1 winged helix-turn-helix domain-containing protein [Glaciihabitans sp. INWT7]
MSDREISAAQARRIALAAQGFGRPRPADPGIRQLNSTIDRLGLLQLDSVNVFERSHYLPMFARIGAYDKADLDRLTFGRKSRFVEYWAHEAAIIPVETWPLYRWRMEANRARYSTPGSWVAENGPMLDWLRAELVSRGAVAASEIEHDTGKGEGGWWGWSEVKTGLEWLFRFGEAVSAGRSRFERRYALASEALPTAVFEREVPQAEAIRELLRLSARAHGIGTLSDLADYYRIKNEPARAAVNDLVDAGELVLVTVRGWNRPAFLHREARIPRRIDATALLSPFDPVVWERARAERMFGFHYRIEIYTPAHKRVFGYYTLPLLIDDRLAGRVDLKNDRQNRVLRVQSAWTEPDAPPATAARLAILLRETASWQGLERIEVVARGDLSPALAAELGVQALPMAE